jgi:Reverse transcriptase (RNA-dependent DNA polymerase)
MNSNIIENMRFLYEKIHKTHIYPFKWLRGKLVCLAKKDNGFSGKIAQLRPITLLETISKLFTKTFFARITNSLTRYLIPTGANTSVLPGTSTFDSLLPLSVFLNERKRTKREGNVFLEDKSAAFDSTSYSQICHALKRIGTPQNVIDLYLKFATQRKLAATTSYGLTPTFTPDRGIPQGGVESLLIWLISYDICLSKVRNKLCGFTSHTIPCLPNFDLETITRKSSYIEILMTSFMDDLCMFFNTKQQEEKAIELVQEFNTIAKIRTNPTKSQYVAFNCKDKTPLIVNQKEIFPAKSTINIRLLGSFFSMRNCLKNSSKRSIAFLNKETLILNKNK